MLWQNASCAEAVKAFQRWLYDTYSGRQISSNAASCHSRSSFKLLQVVETNINVHDSVAWKKLWEFFTPEDIILADRAYASYINFSLLLKREVDMVTRLNQKRKFSLKDALRRNSKNDIIVKW